MKRVRIRFEADLVELVPDDYDVDDPWSMVIEAVGKAGVNVVDVEEPETLESVDV